MVQEKQHFKNRFKNVYRSSLSDLLWQLIHSCRVLTLKAQSPLVFSLDPENTNKPLPKDHMVQTKTCFGIKYLNF